MASKNSRALKAPATPGDSLWNNRQSPEALPPEGLIIRAVPLAATHVELDEDRIKPFKTPVTSATLNRTIR